MAGPSVVVRVLGDLSKLSQSFTEVQARGSAAARGMHEAFSGVLGTLNRTGVLGPFGDALAGIDGAMQNVSKHAKEIGPAMLGIGGALAGVGVGLSAIGSKDQAAHQQLQQAVQATGKDYEDYAGSVEKAIKQQEKYGHTANQTQDALRILTQAMHDPAKALEYLGLASDIAAAKHEDLSTAATQVGKVYNGNTKLLKEYGVSAEKSVDNTNKMSAASKQAQVADENLAKAKQHLADVQASLVGKTHLTTYEQIQLRDAQQKVADATAKATDAHKKMGDMHSTVVSKTQAATSNIDQLSKVVAGQASASANTFTGHLNALKAQIEDTAAKFGQKYGPAITAAGSGMAILGAGVTATQGIIKSFTDVQKTQTAVTEGVTAAQDAEAASSWAALGPVLLIIAAIAALVAIGYVLYKNWDTIWSGIKDAVKVVWDWIRVNWPLLVGILLGPIGIAAALIYQHWQEILNGAKTAFSAVYHFIVDPIAAALSWVGGALDTVASWFTALPKRIGDAFATIVSYLVAPFRWAFNVIADLWNNTVGKLSFHIPSWVPFGLGGQGWSMPHIPKMDQGGLITAEGLVYAHAGEVISPAPPLRTGPAVVINDAHFSSEVDVELFMRKAAWTVQTQRI
jgi:hypothetical protein